MADSLSTASQTLLQMHDALSQRTISRLDGFEAALLSLKRSYTTPAVAAESSAGFAGDQATDRPDAFHVELRRKTLENVSRIASMAQRDHRVMQTALAACRRDIASLTPPSLHQLSPTEDSLGDDAEQLLAQAVVQHLGVEGESSAAKALAAEAGVQPTPPGELQAYSDIHRIANGLHTADCLQQAIAWCVSRSRQLQTRRSKLLFRLHALQYMHVLMGTHTPQSIKAARGQCSTASAPTPSGQSGPHPPPAAQPQACSPASAKVRMVGAKAPHQRTRAANATLSGGQAWSAEGWSPVSREHAFAYARKFLHEHMEHHQDDIGRLLSCAIFMPHLERSPYADLGRLDELCQQVGTLYRRDRCAVEGLRFESPLFQVLAASAVARPVFDKLQRRLLRRGQGMSLPSPGDGEGELPVEVPLPESLLFHSVFVCPVMRSAVDTRDDPPSLLPCGHLISSQAVSRLLGDEDEGGCPLCHTPFHEEALQKVLIQ